MQTLEVLGKRIRTTEDFKAIVRTMKSLSAVSIHQYETAGAAIAEYHSAIELGLQIALAGAATRRGSVDRSLRTSCGPFVRVRPRSVWAV